MRLRARNKPVDHKLPVVEACCHMPRIGIARRHARAVCAENRRPLVRRELLGKRHAILKRAVKRIIRVLTALQHIAKRRIVAQRIAARHKRAGAADKQGATGQNAAHAISPTGSAILTGRSCETRNLPVIIDRIWLYGPDSSTSSR